jgi:predicted RNA methylase|tara:strand:+ start:1878 stop:2132 length:255 start_codon:yes stop_codon:yes gene_type:complete
MGKLKDQLAGIAALIGVLGAIGAGFVKYGEMQEQLSNLGALDIDPLVKEIAGQNVKISVLEKTIEVLELEIKELKASSKNPLAN